MAVIRCPNCGKPNPDFLQVCQYCDKPLGAGGAAPEQPEAAAEPANDLPDWLRTTTGPLPGEPAPTPPAGESGDLPEWLKPTLGAEGGAAEPAGDVPDWLKSITGPLSAESAALAESAEPGAVPDWVQRATTPLPAQPASDLPDWLSQSTGPLSATPGAAEPTEIPDWLKSLGGTSALPETPAAAPVSSAPDFSTEAAPAADVPDWLKSLGGTSALPETPAAAPVSSAPDFSTEAAPAADVPDWLKSLGGAAAVGGVAAAASAPEPEPDSVPDWLKTNTGVLPETPAPAEAVPDWLKQNTGPLSAPFGEPAAPSEDMPDWLRQATSPLPSEPAAPAKPKGTAPFTLPIDSPEAAPEAPTEWAVPAAADETPNWLKALGAEAAPAPSAREAAAPEPVAAAPAASSEPDWLAALREQTASANTETLLPATAPFGEPPAPPAEEAPPIIPASAEPDWLAALRATPTAAEDAAPLPSIELAQGELPQWLAAMRPVDVQPTDIEKEVDDYQETVGVLTGMKGVLRAEPSVVLPGRSATQVHALHISKEQNTNAEMLAGMLAADRAVTPAAKRRTRGLPWERWVITLVLLIGLLAPVLTYRDGTSQVFIPPSTLAPQEVIDAKDFINTTLTTEKPVLVAFDYEPSQAGEMDPIAEALVSNLMRRGLRIAGLSTSVAGAGVAEAVLNRLANDEFLRGNAPNNYRNYGELYVNLGYVPGGPVGILQFSLNPQSVIRSDYRAQYMQSTELWTQAPITGVTSLEGFGAVIVLSAAPEDARAWIEQTQASQTPLVLAVSGGAGPMVRPYYEGDRERIRGFMSGPLSAVQYTYVAGAPTDGQALQAMSLRWQMLGGGLLSSALLLGFGALAYGLARLLRRQKVRA